MVLKYFLTLGIICTIIGCANTMSVSKKGQPKVVDPVCAYFSDMGCIHIMVDENTPNSNYEGVTYYFCSKECKVDFDKDPLKYLRIVTPPEDTIDLVCHMKIDELKRFVTCVYQDKIYYFCSDYCRTKYITNPDYYPSKECNSFHLLFQGY